MNANPTIEIATSWNGRVDRSAGPLACWPWRGSFVTNGYGQSRVKENGRWRGAGAHQIAHYLATGVWERKSAGRLVRHLCHNRPCCNPAHLVGGSHQDNSDDRVARSRGECLVPTNNLILGGRSLAFSQVALDAWGDLQLSAVVAVREIADTELVTRLRRKLKAISDRAWPDLSPLAVKITRDFLQAAWRWVSEPMPPARAAEASGLLALALLFDDVLTGAGA